MHKSEVTIFTRGCLYGDQLVAPEVAERSLAGNNLVDFYTLVARDTVEQEHSSRRQRFLTEQGYHYEIVDASDLD